MIATLHYGRGEIQRCVLPAINLQQPRVKLDSMKTLTATRWNCHPLCV